MIYEIQQRIGQALEAAGEKECRTTVSKGNPGKLRYMASDTGWRMHRTIDGPLLLAYDPTPSAPWYFGVAVKGDRVRELRRLAEILNKAGLPTVICGTHLYPSVKRLWVTLPTPRG